MSEQEHDATESAAEPEPENSDEVDEDEETDDDVQRRRPGDAPGARNVGG